MRIAARLFFERNVALLSSGRFAGIQIIKQSV
jgi:hypothetical protein